MSKVDYYIKMLKKLKEKQNQDFRELAECKGRIKALKEVYSSDDQAQSYLTLYGMILKEIEYRRTEVLAICELFLGLHSDQEKVINSLWMFHNHLWNIIKPLAFERSKLSDKIENLEKWKKRIEKWRKEREKLLSEIDSFVEERRRFYDEHK